MSTPLFLTSQQVSDRWAQAGILGRCNKPISPATLAFWRSEGTGPSPVKAAGAIRYGIKALRRYERENFGQECDVTQNSDTHG
ncbi:hypothetical protein [Thalassospira lucentensis]|uniref:hypothetical protein n=1 Tax=Thalassospira lucentensis TaxID=168935 RepID=UPI003D274152